MTQLIIGILATWRVASLLFTEGGPFQVFDRFRAFFHVTKSITGDTVCKDQRNQVCKMLECFWCTSVWAALAVSIMLGQFNLVNILAWSAGAIFLGFISQILQNAMSTSRYKPHSNGKDHHAEANSATAAQTRNEAS